WGRRRLPRGFTGAGSNPERSRDRIPRSNQRAGCRRLAPTRDHSKQSCCKTVTRVAGATSIGISSTPTGHQWIGPASLSGRPLGTARLGRLSRSLGEIPDAVTTEIERGESRFKDRSEHRLLHQLLDSALCAVSNQVLRLGHCFVPI